MQGLPLKEFFNSSPASPRDPPQEGVAQPQLDMDTRSVNHSDHQVEGEIEIIEQGFLSSNDPPLTDPHGPPLLESPPMTTSVGSFLQISPIDSFDNYTTYLQNTAHLPCPSSHNTTPFLPISSSRPIFPSPTRGVSQLPPIGSLNINSTSTTSTPPTRTPNLPPSYNSLSKPKPPYFYTPSLLDCPSLSPTTHVPDLSALVVNTLSTHTHPPTI